LSVERAESTLAFTTPPSDVCLREPRYPTGKAVFEATKIPGG
jgi:hypothetical protein